MELRISERQLFLREPLLTSFGPITSRTLFEVELFDGDISGRGEAAPLEPYDGVSPELVRAALDEYARVIAGLSDTEGPAILAACREAADLPQALAAVDMALWDRAGRRADAPVAHLLAGDPLPRVQCNALVQSIDQAVRDVQRGFTCLKLKVGVGDDARSVAALRAAVGQAVRLRLDANGAWDVETAVAAIEALSPAGLELVEEPVSGVDALRQVRERVAVRIAMDETAATHGALASGAADAVCLKISRAGGIAPLLAQAALVRSTGADVYLASTLDGPLGIAAAAHCAAALRCELPSGLATLGLFEEYEPSPAAIAIDAPGLL
ncbi:MAG TPA: enolase C-terminal domain-like protein [Baekduia sp.]|nr:enolase C-terminal domain-like protein [Baekduia sp.]